MKRILVYIRLMNNEIWQALMSEKYQQYYKNWDNIIDEYNLSIKEIENVEEEERASINAVAKDVLNALQ